MTYYKLAMTGETKTEHEWIYEGGALWVSESISDGDLFEVDEFFL